MTTTSPFGAIADYMAEFAPEMSARTEAGLRPLFDPSKEPLSAEVQEIMRNPLGFHRPKPAQAVVVEGTVRELATKQVTDLCGEQGSGKTPMALWVARVMLMRRNFTPHRKRSSHPKYIRVVLTCPNQLVKKWADHADKILPECKSRIVRSYRDLIPLARGFKPACNEVWVIPRDIGKLSYAWRPGVTVKTRPVEITTEDGPMMVDGDLFHCPRCDAVIKAEIKGRMTAVGLSYFTNSKGGPGARRECQDCHEPLWQAYNGTPDRFRPDMPAPGMHPRRCSPAEFIWRKRIRFDLYIADEQHENANMSLQGASNAHLAALSTKTILATGTLTGGYATNLLHTLWRTEPSRMRADGLTHDEAGHENFVLKYGVIQTRKKYVAKDSYQSVQDLILGRGKCKSTSVKVLPGISPQLYTRMLLPRSVFVRLLEMEDSLPEFTEKVCTVPLTLDQAKALDEMTKQFTKHANAMKASGEPCRAWSAARACFLRWPDRPWPAYDIYDRDKEGRRILALQVPALSQSQELPKELRLRRIITAEKLQGRKVCVYTEMTGVVWSVIERLTGYLESHGIKCAILKTKQAGGPEAEDRDEWITEAMKEADALICHPGLVQTGLDLLACPTLIFQYCGEKCVTLRQASRRAWRLGQTKPCKVFYLSYQAVKPEHRAKCSYKSLQSAALSLMASKMAASLALEGDFSSEGLAAMSDSEDIASKLAKVIAGQLQTEDPKVAMARYREALAKMMPEPVKLVGDPACATNQQTSTLEPEPSTVSASKRLDDCSISGSTEAKVGPASRTESPRYSRPSVSPSLVASTKLVQLPVPETQGETGLKNGAGTFAPAVSRNPGAPLVTRSRRPMVKSDLRSAMGRLSELLKSIDGGGR